MTDRHNLEASVEFAENPEPRCACVLLLDTSGSMSGAPIHALNEGLRTFRDEIVSDPVSVRRVEVAVVAFDSTVRVEHDFVNPDQFIPPTLSAQGLTHMGEGIRKALDLIEDRKRQYSTSGIAFYRPWVFLITDGEPQGEPDQIVRAASERIRRDEAAKRVAFFAVGVEGVNLASLQQISVRPPLMLKGLNFKELFVWLSHSMSSVSHSRPEDQAALPPVGWSTV